MLKKFLQNRLFLVFVFFSVARITVSSPAYDKEYGYRNIAAIVTNTEKEPVYGEQVENEIVSFLRSNLRFEFSDKGYLSLKEKFHPAKVPDLTARSPSSLWEPSRPLLTELGTQGLTAIIFGEVINENGSYSIALQLATTAKGESVFHTKVPVEIASSLDSFTAATRTALTEMMKAIPFDAAIVRRDGYLVVLDRGTPGLQVGQQLSAFTIEKDGKDLRYEETGVIGLTDVEENMAFGKILVERHPLEVLVGNKIRLDNAPLVQVSPSVWSIGERGTASASSSMEEFEVTKGKLGVLNASLGMGLTTFSNTNAAGVETNHLNMVYPGGTIGGELWLTSRVTLNASMKYEFSPDKSVGGTTNAPVGSSINETRITAGYRINLLAPEPGPVLHFKAGYGTESFSFSSSQELLFTSVAYSGILLGGGVTFPIADKYGLGFDINTLIFPGVSETPVTTGTSISDVSAWDFVLRGYYSYDKDIDFEAKLIFQRNGANFSGPGTRLLNTDTASTAETTKGLLFGINYYF